MNMCLDGRDLRRLRGATSPIRSAGSDPDGGVEV